MILRRGGRSVLGIFVVVIFFVVVLFLIVFGIVMGRFCIVLLLRLEFIVSWFDFLYEELKRI